ncbi:MAG TPA: aminodeoxychorismate/anthranilate synthase component II [Brumimicrobium sp.]|nr:aminodeoxychorismate/anthranilate synthase component II [Brumimicrobium sp.]
MKILVIDNYDSFTYNLVYILRQESDNVAIYRNDKINAQDCLAYDAILLSPGPGVPKEAGNLMDILNICAGKVPILGVCLGHQAIAEHLGGKLRMLDKVYHGVQDSVNIKSSTNPLFEGLSKTIQAGRYHSWEVDPNALGTFEITAETDEHHIMAIQNTEQNLYGIQFHPESILTPEGDLIVRNFLQICKNIQS